MAPKTGNRKSNSKDSADWQKYEFVNLNLTEAEKEDFKKQYATESDKFLRGIDELLQAGYKLSVTWDKDNKCAIASLTCREPQDPNFNYVLTARSGDMWEAQSLVMYKHLYVCDDGDWGGDTQQDRNSWG